MTQESWSPFILTKPGRTPPSPRSLSLPEGLGDRMRTAAFAEFQAVRAFRWASKRFVDTSESLREEWANLVSVEVRHFEMIAKRMLELGFSLSDRPVSLRLWNSLNCCKTGKEFCVRICSAEEWGRQSAIKLIEFLTKRDEKTANVFKLIAKEEIEHVAVADRYFGWKPSQR